MPRTFFKSQGYFAELLPAKGKGLESRHALCGPQDVPGAECMNCRRPLLMMMTLDLTDERLNFFARPTREELLLTGEGMDVVPEIKSLTDLPLFYCWACGNPLAYLLNRGGGVDVLDHTRLTMSDAKPERPDYPKHLPARRLKLTPVPKDVQNLMRGSNQGKLTRSKDRMPSNAAYLRPRHQVGGEPFLVQGNQGDSSQPCALCNCEMPILAVIGDESGQKGGFVGDAFVQVIFYYCAPCQVVVAMNECD